MLIKSSPNGGTIDIPDLWTLQDALGEIGSYITPDSYRLAIDADDTASWKRAVAKAQSIGPGSVIKPRFDNSTYIISQTITITFGIIVEGNSRAFPASGNGDPGTSAPSIIWAGAAGARMFEFVSPIINTRVCGGGISGFRLNGAGIAAVGIAVVQGDAVDTSKLFLTAFTEAGVEQLDTNSAIAVSFQNTMRDIWYDCGSAEACYFSHGLWVRGRFNEGNAAVTNCRMDNIHGQTVCGDVIRINGHDTGTIISSKITPRVGAWRPSTAVIVAQYVYYRDNVYKCTIAGTTDGPSDGAGPLFTSGTATNGTATFQWIGPLGSAVNHTNETVKWAQGQTIAIGDRRYWQRFRYIAESAGTTGATPPTHTSGSVSDGGVTWGSPALVFNTAKNVTLHIARGWAKTEENTTGNIVVVHNGEGGGSRIAANSTLHQIRILDHITGAAFRSWVYELDDELPLSLAAAYADTGSPALTTGGSAFKHQHWAFDAASTELINWEFRMPAHWEDGVIKEMKITVMRSGTDAVDRHALLRVSLGSWLAGFGYNTTSVSYTEDFLIDMTDATVAVDATLTFATPFAVTEGKILGLQFGRVGGDASDDQPNDLLLIAPPMIHFNGYGPNSNSNTGPFEITPRKLSY